MSWWIGKSPEDFYRAARVEAERMSRTSSPGIVVGSVDHGVARRPLSAREVLR